MDLNTAAFIQKSPEAWRTFCERFALNDRQQTQFAQFGALLISWNQMHNLTAITDVHQIIADHFADSLSITRFLDVNQLRGLADVGTGGGFPGIPLKIMFPAVPMVLIEVNVKKIAFLEEVIEVLGLENIQINDMDWRTFLRKTQFSIDLFCARASLRPDELIRMFAESSPYKHAHLVYWSSQYWKLSGKEELFFDREEVYEVEEKKRKLIFFKRS